MCGIAGWLGDVDDPESVACQAARTLRHRGPDGSETLLRSDAGLVHTRLSIIDLSAAATQPMSNEDGTVWTVFNGEIYNHRELRRWLQGRGHVFRSRCDTEVIPHLYEEDGAGFPSRLRGMFAIAVLDTRRMVLVLTRDRFGIKPLYYTADAKESGRTIAFASELGTLAQFPGTDTRPDAQAVHDFAALSYIPSPQTFFRGIRSLDPGEVLQASLSANTVERRVSSFHSWTISPDLGLSELQAVDATAELITAAVGRQVESDVPLGALLSGGIDSSLVSAAAAGSVAGKLPTFNARFRDPRYDETWAALEVSGHIGSDHSVLDMGSERGTWSDVTTLLRRFGQPFADTSMFGVSRVCRLARKHVTVALSGDGGDETFGGYNWHWQYPMLAKLRALPSWAWGGAAMGLGAGARANLVPRQVANAARDLAGADDVSVLEYLLTWVRPREHAALCVGDDLLPVRRHFERHWDHDLPRGATKRERLSALGTEAGVRMNLVNDFLPKVDIASMHESLEIRVPMLDEELFDFGMTLPHRLKCVGREAKPVLRKVAARTLPPAVASKPKHGFGVPVGSWVDDGFKAQLRETLLGPGSGLPQFFREEAYRPLVQAFCDDVATPSISYQGLAQRVIILLAVHLSLDSSA